MFCVIKYIDYDQYQFDQSQNNLPADSYDHGNQILLINPDCPIGILRDYIGSKLRISGDNADESNDFELCTEKLSLLDTRQCLPTAAGLNILKNKETYYIVLLNTNNDQPAPFPILTPLLCPGSREYLEFMSQQRKKSSMTKLKRRSSKGSSIVSSNTASSSVQNGIESSKNVPK